MNKTHHRHLRILEAKVCGLLRNLGQSIQEWTKWNLWKTAFKKFKVIWSGLLKQTISLQLFYRLCLPQISIGPFLNWPIQISIGLLRQNHSKPNQERANLIYLSCEHKKVWCRANNTWKEHYNKATLAKFEELRITNCY